MSTFSKDAHDQFTFAANASTGALICAGPTIYWGLSNVSITAQSNAVKLFDAPSLAAALSGSYPVFDQPVLGAGQDLDKSIANKGRECKYGLVAIPAGPLNGDGGATVVYDAIH